MNYYNRYPGDYARDTQELSLAEHGAYALLLDYIYGTEKNLPGNPVGCYRVARAFTEEEKAAVDSVLSKFFILTESGYENARAKRELALALPRVQAARENGKKGGRKPSGLPAGVPDGVPSEKAHQPPTTNQKNISPNGDRQSSADHCPHEEILNLFAEQLPQLTQPLRSRWSGSKGAELLRTRWREDKRHQSKEFWSWYFGIVQRSKFHLGENERGWKADLPWLLKRENFDKMLAKGVQS